METRRVNVRGIIVKDGKLFAQRFKLKNGGETDFWATPGGGLELGESLQTGLKREMIEETGIAPDIGKLLFIQQFTHHKDDGTVREELEFFFHVKNADDYEVVDLSKTTHGTIELTRCDFIDPSAETVLPAFLKDIDIKAYITTDKPVYFYSELR